jgi:pantetheine-phosphate adenylyltransferase
MSGEVVGIFPGSFDPITLGHLDIIRRASKICDRVIVGVGVSAEKSGLFTGDEKLQMVKDVCKDLKGIEVQSYTGLTVEFAKAVNATCIVRGLRGASDLEYENRMTYMNKKLSPNLETIYFPTNPEFSHVSSSLARDVAKHNGDLTDLVPTAALKVLKNKF